MTTSSSTLILHGDPWATLRAGLWVVVFTAALFILPLDLLHRRMVRESSPRSLEGLTKRQDHP